MLSLVNSVIAPISSVKRTVRAPRASVNLSGSIAARTAIAATSATTATAIFNKISVLMLVCHVSSEPRTESRTDDAVSDMPETISLRESIRPPVDSSTPPVRELNQPLTATIRLASIPELKTSINDPKSAVPKISPKPDVIFEIAVTIISAAPLKISPTPENIEPSLETPPVIRLEIAPKTLPKAFPRVTRTPVNAPDSVTALAAPVTNPASWLIMLPISPPEEDITPKNSPIPDATLPIIEPIDLRTENIAVNTSLTTGAAPEANVLKSFIKFLKPVEILVSV